MREEASMIDANGGVSPLSNTPVTSDLPPLSDVQQQQQQLLSSPAPRFEFYTDPLAAYGASQRKKSRSSFGSPFSPRPKLSPSPLPHPSFGPPNISGTSAGTFSHSNFVASSSSGTSGIPANMSRNPIHSPSPRITSPHGYSPIPSSNHQSGLFSRPWIATNTSPNYTSPYNNHSPNHTSATRGSYHSSMMIPGGFTTTLSSSHHSNSQSSGHRIISTSYDQSEAVYLTPHVPGYTGSKGKLSAGSPQRHPSGSNNSSACYYDKSHSWGSFRQSPGSNKATPVRTGGKGFQRPFGKSIGEILAKRSMLEDPWKDLMPVRIESVAVRLDSCTSSSHNWLPRSVTRKSGPSHVKGVSVHASGPSLAESLAASFADAVAGEDNF
ncbi:hypothetical protein KP509_29G067500 [Ceratopteris richardii]|nr:hypothetical protein KP509_29G067500 [Ceratopteris richardii]